ncbi:MAG: hypothetical protein ACYS5V_06905, partial [Planctomycetota bacterium]
MLVSLKSMTRWGQAAVVVLAMLAAGQAACADEAPGQWKAESFAIERVAPQEAWASETVDPAKWRPVAQPDLAGQLAKAKALAYEPVAAAPKRCWHGQKPFLVPNPDGKSWDMIYPYYNTYRKEQEMIIHDFGTGKTSRQTLSIRKGESVLTREAIGFHMRPSFYTAGKLVFDHYGPVLYTVYDPAEDRFVHGVKPFGNKVFSGRGVLGDDGKVYGMGWEVGSPGFVAYRFDPKTHEAKRFKTFGPSNRNRREVYCVVRMHGDWLYMECGARPWHLVAFNVKTEEGRLLATTKNIIGSYATIQIWGRKGGMAGVIFDAAEIDGIEDHDGKKFEFWLHDGRIYRRDGEIPPWSDKPAVVKKGRRFNWARGFQVWADDFTPPSPPPVIQSGSGKPDVNGDVRLKYRPGGQTETAVLEYRVKLYPGVVNLLSEVNAHVLYATDAGYGQNVFYNVATKQLMPVGGFVSPYALGYLNNRWYVSGYPNMQLFEYDFTRKIGLARGNPKRVAWLGHKNETHVPIAGIVGGADGRVYASGVTYGRRRVGGGYGWYDPKTGQSGGEPVAGHRFFWMAAADHGRYVLMATKYQGNGELMAWDTQKQDFIYKKRILDQATPGPIVEALPGGLVIGHTG